MQHIRKRADFLRAQKGRRQSTPGLGLEVCASPAALGPGALGPQALGAAKGARFGVTASRKVGGAVARNRAKRRLRAVAAAILPLSGRNGHDYVLIARVATLLRPFPALIGDLSHALAAAHQALDRQERAH